MTSLILEFNTKTFTTIIKNKFISFLKYNLNFKGLKIDDNGNIFTIAHQYYETGNSHLYCFNKNGEILYKTNLNINSELITDFVIDNITDRNKIRMIACGEKKIHFIEF